VLENNKVVTLIFKVVNKLYNVRMLTYLQNVDLPALLVDLNYFHLFLACSLDCHPYTFVEMRAL
jgi:hypothetical protein